MALHILYLQIFVSLLMAAAAGQAVDECQRECGGISVPYPFGLGDSSKCFKDENFKLTCNYSFNPPLVRGRNIPVFRISIENHTAIVGIPILYACYNKSGLSDRSSLGASLTTPFLFSTSNRFVAVGCDTVAYIGDRDRDRFTSGCLTVCSSNNIKGLKNPFNFTQELISCEGIGCCQTQVPKQLDTLSITLSSLGNHSSQLDTNPCSFGFLANPTWYKDESNFTLADLPEKQTRSQVVLDWAIRGNETCGDTDICGQNTECSSSTNGPGYLCSCMGGFVGNPYNETGCQDIDECKDPEKYPCSGKCKNTPGNYTCTCTFGRQGDGKVGCMLSTTSEIMIGVGAGGFIVTLGISLFWLHKKKTQEMNHRRNGGLLLDQLTVKSFREKQLEKATDNFDTKQLLGEGGNGWVYKGSLDMMEIAVKKSKLVDQNQIEQFLNEADIVSKINHKNVVKLLGVCLECKVPMLVYEFVPNGTLYQHLHGTDSRVLDSWRICLRVAAETARALDYMHSLARPPIIHRDVKSSNILLDGTYTAKVADFGASKLIRMDRAIAPTQGQGTMGYLDPEYLQTGELTTMSDVYGFGVVLMELLSKQKPISRGISGELIGLVKIFTSAVENNHFDQVLKVAEVSEHEAEQVDVVARLAIKCVAMPSTRRPTMSEVVDVLNGMSKEYSRFPVQQNGDDIISLLDDQDIITTSVHFELE